jgi:hypothetical protein
MASSSEMRIRALTTAIYLLQPKGIPSASPISGIPATYRVLSEAYTHLAILLSQGSNGAVAVTGNTDHSAICAVNIQEIEDSLHIAFRENADHRPSDKDLLKVQNIEPSTKTLHDLADPSIKYVHLVFNRKKLTPILVRQVKRLPWPRTDPIYSKHSLISPMTGGGKPNPSS